MSDMKLTDKLKMVRDALIAIHDDVWHYEEKDKSDRYIVWAEDGEGDTSYADNHVDSQVLTGLIDLYSKDEYDQLIDQIQEALDVAGICFRLESVMYEDETEYIHYQWRFEVA